MSQIATSPVLERLHQAVRSLDTYTERFPLMDVDIAHLIQRLEEMCRRPPGMKTRDFEHAGAAVPMSEDEVTADTLLERIIDESDLLPVWFLERGVTVQRAVARVVLTRPFQGFPPGTGFGTGFLVSPSLFLTNNHVLPDVGMADQTRMQFNFQLAPDGSQLEAESFLPDGEDFFRTNVALDYTLIRLKNGSDAENPVVPGKRWGFVPLVAEPSYRAGQKLNIVQHPSGRPKQIALQNNPLVGMFENTIRYETDTEPGSSGSPVFDNLWQLSALHHAAGERDPATRMFVNNEGIRIDRIVEDLRRELTGTETGNAILAELGI